MNKNIKSLIENIVNFDVADYQDEKDSIIDSHTIHNALYKYFPETSDELKKLVAARIEKNPKAPYLLDIETSKIDDMSDLFMAYDNGDEVGNYYIKDFELTDQIEILDLSTWDTSNVEDMLRMFCRCYNLKKLNIQNFNTSKVKSMVCMFCYCQSLEKLDLSNFDTSNVTDMEDMFWDCRTLKELDLSNFDTLNVTNMSEMFGACTNLNKLSIPFDTSKVTDMSWMFRSCSSLKKLDLMTFSDINTINKEGMFNDTDCKVIFDISKFKLF